ncbi:unnamed protein product [Caenorhabditis nigoni]
MNSSILFILFFIFGCFSQGIPHLKFSNQEAKALKIGKQHVEIFLDSIKNKDEKMIRMLFNSTETDRMHIPTLIDMLQGFDISVESANFNQKGEINANLRVDGIVPGVIILTKVSHFSKILEKSEILRLPTVQLDIKSVLLDLKIQKEHQIWNSPCASLDCSGVQSNIPSNGWILIKFENF